MDFFFLFNSTTLWIHIRVVGSYVHVWKEQTKILSSLFTLSVRHICTSTNSFQSPLNYFELILTDISNCSQALNHHFTLIFNVANGTICQNHLLNLVNLI